MTNIQEVDTDKHIKMSLIEFIDAFARVADKVTMAVIDLVKYIIILIAQPRK